MPFMGLAFNGQTVLLTFIHSQFSFEMEWIDVSTDHEKALEALLLFLVEEMIGERPHAAPLTALSIKERRSPDLRLVTHRSSF